MWWSRFTLFFTLQACQCLCRVSRALYCCSRKFWNRPFYNMYHSRGSTWRNSWGYCVEPNMDPLDIRSIRNPSTFHRHHGYRISKEDIQTVYCNRLCRKLAFLCQEWSSNNQMRSNSLSAENLDVMVAPIKNCDVCWSRRKFISAVLPSICNDR